jgi:ankyrin repeat protein
MLLTWAGPLWLLGAVRLLLEDGNDVNTTDNEGDTALHCAAIGGHEEVASLLLSNGADASRRGCGGRTALMDAASCGNENVLRLLLRYLGGRGLDERGEDGCTALWLACWSQDENVGIVRVLLMTGADHTIPDNEGRTPLQIAQSKNHPQCTAVIEVSTPCIVTCECIEYPVSRVHPTQLV